MLAKTKRVLIISCAVLVSLIQFNFLQMSVFALPLPLHYGNEVVNLNDPEWGGENPFTRQIELVLGKKFAQGITYKDLKTIKILDLSGKNLTNLPPAIGYLINLEDLNLDNNHFTSVPDVILNCRDLVSLYMNNNQIVEIPIWIGDFPELERARFYGNSIASIEKLIDRFKIVEVPKRGYYGNKSVIQHREAFTIFIHRIPVDVFASDGWEKIKSDLCNQLIHEYMRNHLHLILE